MLYTACLKSLHAIELKLRIRVTMQQNVQLNNRLFSVSLFATVRSSRENALFREISQRDISTKCECSRFARENSEW